MEHILDLTDNMGHTFFSMYYNRPKNYLFCQWQGQTIAEDVYAGSRAQLEWAENNAMVEKCSTVMNDCRLIKGSLVDTTDWASTVWSPTMYKLGMKYNAILQSDDIFSQLSLDSFQELSAGEGHITNKIFNDQALAEEWLRSKVKS